MTPQTMKPNNLPEKKICEVCHKEFSCGATIGKCWCFEVEISQETLEQLKQDFQNCLCEDCLKKIEKEVNEENNVNSK